MYNYERLQKELTLRNIDAILLENPRNVLYATGFLAHDSSVFLTKDRLVLMTDSRYYEEARLKCRTSTEIMLRTATSSIDDMINTLLNEENCKTLAIEEQDMSLARFRHLEKFLGCDFVNGQSLVSDVRMIKSEYELGNIIKAQRIAERALDEVLNDIKVGVSEREIAAKLEYLMKVYGAEELAFPTIVVSGKKSSLPHGVPDGKLIEAGDFVTMDFGCTVNGYCSDMTRTVAVEYVSDEMATVYETVLKAQKAGIELASAKVTGAEVHKAASEVIEAAGYGEYFGHGFGHGIGLVVHEAPNASPRNEKLLPVGAVISAEPGIYLEGKFGVRIEDMLYIEQNGNRNLTMADKRLMVL